MSDDASVRAECANQLIPRLRGLSEDDWTNVVGRAEPCRPFIAMARDLARHATDLLEPEDGVEARRAIDARLGDVAALFPDAASPGSPEPPLTRATLAQGVLLAVMLRGTRGFNHGAWLELTAPFAGAIDLAGLELRARTLLQPDVRDSSALGTPPAPGPLPRDVPGARRA